MSASLARSLATFLPTSASTSLGQNSNMQYNYGLRCSRMCHIILGSPSVRLPKACSDPLQVCISDWVVSCYFLSCFAIGPILIYFTCSQPSHSKVFPVKTEWQRSVMNASKAHLKLQKNSLKLINFQ